MDIMEKVQCQYGCTVLAAQEMNPHCLTVLTLDTTFSMTIIIISSMALITILSFMTTICVTTTAMLQFIVQVNNEVIVQITNAMCLFMSNDIVFNASNGFI